MAPACRKHAPDEDGEEACRFQEGDAAEGLRIGGRWKWNAPSFYVDPKGALDPEDVPMDRNIANVNLHREQEAMLVLLYPHGLPDDLPDWLDGSWKDRRTASFRTTAEVRARKGAALQRMLREMARRVPS